MQLHAEYVVLVHAFLSKLNYYLRTTPNIHDLLSLLEFAIRQKFLSTVIPHPPNDIGASLSVSLGGLEICDPYSISLENYRLSYELSHSLSVLAHSTTIASMHQALEC